MNAREAWIARPYVVYWLDSFGSCTNRFDTFSDAFQYIQDMWAMIRREVALRPNMESSIWHSTIQTPTGTMPLAYYLLADNVSSFYD